MTLNAFVTMDLTPEQQSRQEHAKEFFNYNNEPVDAALSALAKESAIKVKELQNYLQDITDKLDREFLTSREG